MNTGVASLYLQLRPNLFRGLIGVTLNRTTLGIEGAWFWPASSGRGSIVGMGRLWARGDGLGSMLPVTFINEWRRQ